MDTAGSPKIHSPGQGDSATGRDEELRAPPFSLHLSPIFFTTLFFSLHTDTRWPSALEWKGLRKDLWPR
jgi:hypothetical protein